MRRLVATWGCRWRGPWARGTWGRDTLVLRLKQERPVGRRKQTRRDALSQAMGTSQTSSQGQRGAAEHTAERGTEAQSAH